MALATIAGKAVCVMRKQTTARLRHALRTVYEHLHLDSDLMYDFRNLRQGTLPRQDDTSRTLVAEKGGGKRIGTRHLRGNVNRDIPLLAKLDHTPIASQNRIRIRFRKANQILCL